MGSPLPIQYYGGYQADPSEYTRQTPSYERIVVVKAQPDRRLTVPQEDIQVNEQTVNRFYNDQLPTEAHQFMPQGDAKMMFLEGLRELELQRAKLMNINPSMLPITYFWQQQLNIIIYLLEDLCYKQRINQPGILLDIVANAMELQRRFRSWHPEEEHYYASEVTQFLRNALPAINYVQQMNRGMTFDINQIITMTSRNSKVDKRVPNIPIQCIPNVTRIKLDAMLDTGDQYSFYRATFGKFNTKCLVKVAHNQEYNNALATQCTMSDLEIASAEAVAASAINSPYVLKVHACFKTQNNYIVLYHPFDGIPLHALVRESFLESPVATILLGQLVTAVDQIHARGIIHFDINASKILISATGNLKLFGFEYSKICMGHHSRAVPLSVFNLLTDMESTYQTRIFNLDYAAPEKMMDCEIGRAVDWWSVGVVGYQLFTGLIPFEQVPPESYLSTLQTVTWPQNHSANGIAIDFINSLLRFNASERYGRENALYVRYHIMFGVVDMEEMHLRRETIGIPEVQTLFSAYLMITQFKDNLEEDNKILDAVYYKPLFTYLSKEYLQMWNAKEPQLPYLLYVDYTEGIDQHGLPVPHLLINGQFNKIFEGSLRLKTSRRVIPSGLQGEYIKLFHVKGEDGETYYMVGDVNKYHIGMTKETFVGHVVRKGDIVTHLNDKPAVLHPPQQKLFKWETDTLLTVVDDTIFHRVMDMAKSARFFASRGVYMTLQKLFPQEFDTGYCTCNPFGFDYLTYEIKYSTENSRPIHIHVIFYVDERLQIRSPGNVSLLVGDVITLINGRPAMSLDENAMEQHIKATAKGFNIMRIEVGPTSPLRFPRKKRYIVN